MAQRPLDANQPSEHVGIRMTAADLAAADHLAVERGITRSQVLREAVAAYIAQQGREVASRAS